MWRQQRRAGRPGGRSAACGQGTHHLCSGSLFCGPFLTGGGRRLAVIGARRKGNTRQIAPAEGTGYQGDQPNRDQHSAEDGHRPHQSLAASVIGDEHGALTLRESRSRAGGPDPRQACRRVSFHKLILPRRMAGEASIHKRPGNLPQTKVWFYPFIAWICGGCRYAVPSKRMQALEARDARVWPIPSSTETGLCGFGVLQRDATR